LRAHARLADPTLTPSGAPPSGAPSKRSGRVRRSPSTWCSRVRPTWTLRVDEVIYQPERSGRDVAW